MQIMNDFINGQSNRPVWRWAHARLGMRWSESWLMSRYVCTDYYWSNETDAAGQEVHPFNTINCYSVRSRLLWLSHRQCSLNKSHLMLTQSRIYRVRLIFPPEMSRHGLQECQRALERLNENDKKKFSTRWAEKTHHIARKQSCVILFHVQHIGTQPHSSPAGVFLPLSCHGIWKC
jgi:hypothetical protein